MSSLLLPANAVLASNTYSTDLELSSSQYWSITDGDQTGLDLSTDFTIEAWIKLEQLPSTSGTRFVFVSKFEDSGDQRSFLLDSESSDKLRLVFDSTGDFNTARTDISSTAAFFVAADVGTWVHIAVAVDISASSIVMYKNSSAVGTTSDATDATSIYNSSSPFFIGARSNTTALDFPDGLMDEVRVWSDIRTSTEISDNYQKELVGDEAGLVGYWKFNNDGTDETSNDNDLTNNNSATFSSSVPFTGALPRRIIKIE